MLVGSLLVGVGAFAPARRLVRPGTAAVAMVAVVLAGLLAATVPVELVLEEWRGQERPPQADLTRTLLSQPLAAIALQMTMAFSLAAASIGLTGRGIRAGDAFARRLGLASLFFAFSMLLYALLPPVTQEWVHLGDVLRLLFCVVLLWAAVLEVAAAVAARAAAASAGGSHATCTTASRRSWPSSAAGPSGWTPRRSSSPPSAPCRTRAGRSSTSRGLPTSRRTVSSPGMPW